MQMTFTRFVVVIVAAVSLGVLAGRLSAADSRIEEGMPPDAIDTLRWSADFPAPYRASMNASSQAFSEGSFDHLVDFLDDDFATFDLKEDGSVNLVRGLDKTISLMNMMMGAENSPWLGAHVQRLGHIGNVVIQVEYDRFKTEQGEETRPSLAIFQFRDGKRWREWRLKPVADEAIETE